MLFLHTRSSILLVVRNLCKSLSRHCLNKLDLLLTWIVLGVTMSMLESNILRLDHHCLLLRWNNLVGNLIIVNLVSSSNRPSRYDLLWAGCVLNSWLSLKNHLKKLKSDFTMLKLPVVDMDLLDNDTEHLLELQQFVLERNHL